MLAFWKTRFLSTLIVVLLLVTVVLNPDDNAIISWDAGDDLYQWHEVRYRSLDLNPQQITYATQVDGLQEKAIRPRSGHWAAEVRACRIRNDEEECSTWTASDVDGKPNPWIIYWKPPPTTGIIIEDF